MISGPDPFFSVSSLKECVVNESQSPCSHAEGFFTIIIIGHLPAHKFQPCDCRVVLRNPRLVRNPLTKPVECSTTATVVAEHAVLLALAKT